MFGFEHRIEVRFVQFNAMLVKHGLQRSEVCTNLVRIPYRAISCDFVLHEDLLRSRAISCSLVQSKTRGKALNAG